MIRPDPEARYTVLPDILRQERRTGASGAAIQIARARAYIARLEAELAADAPALPTPARTQKQRTLAVWRDHLADLIAGAAPAEEDAWRHAAE